MKYLTILGQTPELSLAELMAVYPNIKIISRSDETAVFESTGKIDVGILGGMPKLAEVLIQDTALQNAEDAILNELKKFNKEQKIFFGLSFYGNDNRKQYERLGKKIKNALKNIGYKARWAVSREIALSSVVIKTNKLLTRGFDFDIVFHSPSVIPAQAGIQKSPIQSGMTVTIAKTVAVQDFADYEFRDMRRPARDLVSGMTPPKLAKILINLSRIPPPLKVRGELKGGYESFLDPFCGSGTFLMEAALLGYKKICGSDISEKAVSDSKKNIEWLIKNYQLAISPLYSGGSAQGARGVEIKLCDIKNISKCWAKKFDCIATEPYLGPPIRGTLTLAQAEKLQKELSGLYEVYLKNLSSVLEKNGTLVLIVPFFISGEKNPPPKSPPTPLFKRGGSKETNSSLYKREAGRDFHLTLKIKENGLSAVRPPILYSRPDQKVGREIYILKKI